MIQSKPLVQIIALAMLVFLTGCASHGPELSIPPDLAAPYDEFIAGPQYASAAIDARQQLETAREKYGLPSLSAAVSIDGKLVWAGVSGWADLGVTGHATTRTRYRIGSTSKVVTATSLARLVDAGIMEIDKPISTWLKDLSQPKWSVVTPRQLASHTAGIVDYEQNRDIPGLLHSIREKKQFDSVRASLSVFDGNGLKYEPGTKFRYSSYDVVLLSAAIAAAADRPFLQAIEEFVTAPAGDLTISADYQDREVKDRATFYHRKDGQLRRWRAVNHSYKWAAGGLIASSSDLVRLGGAWLDDEYISPETRAKFWSPQKLSNGEINEQNYAIGWRSNSQTKLLGAERPVHNVHHGGISKGAYSWLNVYPEFKLAVALNTNARLDDFADFAKLEYPLTRLFVEVSDQMGGAVSSN